MRKRAFDSLGEEVAMGVDSGVENLRIGVSTGIPVSAAMSAEKDVEDRRMKPPGE